MVGKVSAENALGQVLICLRMSKLNYIAKETPYSAYVTISKKFVKQVEIDVVEKENIEMDSDEIRKVDKINNLKQKIKDISRRCGMMEFEKENLEVKYEVLRKKKLQWMIKLKKFMPEIGNSLN